MNYLNKSRYFELVNKNKILKTDGSSLYRENKAEYSELLSYDIILTKQVFYENRFQYIELIRKYFEGEINCYSFQWGFFDLYNDHLEIMDNIKNSLDESSVITFSSDSKMENFSSLVEELVPICDALDDSLTEERFHLEIQKIFDKIQQYDDSVRHQILASLEGLENRSFSILKAVSLIFLILLFIPY